MFWRYITWRVVVVPQINMTHLIKHLSFGEDYPGIVNPLDDTDVTAPQGRSRAAFCAISNIYLFLFKYLYFCVYINVIYLINIYIK